MLLGVWGLCQSQRTVRGAAVFTQTLKSKLAQEDDTLKHHLWSAHGKRHYTMADLTLLCGHNLLRKGLVL